MPPEPHPSVKTAEWGGPSAGIDISRPWNVLGCPMKQFEA